MSNADVDQHRTSPIRQKLHHWKNVIVAAFKGWIRQEAVVLVKLAIPIVSSLVEYVSVVTSEALPWITRTSECA